MEATAKLVNFTGINHDVCCNNCICYAAFPGSHESHVCRGLRLDTCGKPIHNFEYIPLLYRLRLLYTNLKYVQESMEYKKKLQNTIGSSTRDDWDSFLCTILREQRGLWKDPQDIDFNFSTDGFSLFKVGQFDVWPPQLINAVLPPNARVLKHNMILTGIIPGPDNLKGLGSFLTPLMYELELLQYRIKAWDGLRKEFTPRGHISLIAVGSIAMAKLMKWTGMGTSVCANETPIG